MDSGIYTLSAPRVTPTEVSNKIRTITKKISELATCHKCPAHTNKKDLCDVHFHLDVMSLSCKCISDLVHVIGVKRTSKQYMVTSERQN